MKTEFEKWKMCNEFLYGEEIKAWIDEHNYTNHFTTEADHTIDLVRKVFELDQDFEGEDADTCSNLIGEISCAWLDCNLHDTYIAIVEFLEWYNEQKK